MNRDAQSKTRTRGIRDAAGKALLLAGSVVLPLLLLEGGLALFRPSRITARPYTERSFCCEYDPVLGWANKPDYSAKVSVDKEFSFTVTHNARGERGPAYPFERAAGRARLVVLGDSFTWGFGVGDDEVFTTILEKLPGTPEVINLGVSGYSVDQEFLGYLERGRRYRPDLVVLCLFAGNDVPEVLAPSVYGYPKPRLQPGSDPPLFLNVPVPRTGESDRLLFNAPSGPLGSVKRFLRQRTHSYPFLASRLNSISALRRLFLAAGLAEEYSPWSGLPPVITPSQQETAWGVVFALLERLRAQTADDGAGLMLVNIPRNERRDPRRRADIARFNDAVAGKLSAFCADRGIVLLDLTESVRRAQDGGETLYSTHPRDIHLNAAGHRLLARELASRMAPLLPR